MHSPQPVYRPRPADRQPIFNAPPGTVILCIAIAAAHFVRVMLPYSVQDALIERFAFVPAAFLAQFGPQGEGLLAGELFSLLSYAFLHGDGMHLFLNVGFLLAFGSMVEWTIGTARMLLLFFACCIAAALAQALSVGAAPIAVIGASGGVYGLLGAAVPYLFRGDVAASRRGALTFVAVIMGLNLLVGLAGMQFLPGPGIAWEAHVGGFVVGFLLIHLLARHPPARRH